MGFKAAWSLLLGAAINFGVLAPWLYAQGVLPEKLGYKAIVGWSVWCGASLIFTSSLLSFALQWRTVVRALQSVSGAFESAGDGTTSREVPLPWFFIGLAILTPPIVGLQYLLFGIKLWMGLLAVILAFFIAIVACRATGETDTTPTSGLGKITQLTFGVLDPTTPITNLMTANVTGGVGLHAADLLTDLKSGYLLKADPRQQFWAQFFGVVAGSLFVVPAYQLIIPNADVLGTEQWPAPSAQTWKGVAELMATGFNSLHPTAQAALFIGGLVGIFLVLLERALPRYARFIPSPTGLGMAFTTPAHNSIAMFVGAAIALYLETRRPVLGEKTIIPVSSGMIAGESLMGVLIAALVVAGVLLP
jgi:OPT family oligopeptide transporter